jgi:hypothetical protein
MKAILRMILWDIMNQLDMTFGWFWVSANDGFPHKLRAFSWFGCTLSPARHCFEDLHMHNNQWAAKTTDVIHWKIPKRLGRHVGFGSAWDDMLQT